MSSPSYLIRNQYSYCSCDLTLGLKPGGIGRDRVGFDGIRCDVETLRLIL